MSNEWLIFQVAHDIVSHIKQQSTILLCIKWQSLRLQTITDGWTDRQEEHYIPFPPLFERRVIKQDQELVADNTKSNLKQVNRIKLVLQK